LYEKFSAELMSFLTSTQYYLSITIIKVKENKLKYLFCSCTGEGGINLITAVSDFSLHLCVQNGYADHIAFNPAGL
jgi:hypothetical protein